MSKKYLIDGVVNHDATQPAVLGGELSTILTTIAKVEPNLSELPIESNVPIAATDGTPNYEIGQADDGSIVFNVLNSAAFDSVHVVYIWSENVIPQGEGEPFKSLATCYIINLPSNDTLRTDPKLREWLESALDKSKLASAKKIAKSIHEGKEGYSFSDDPVTQFLSSHTSPATRERAFNVLFPTIQAAIVKVGAMRAAKLSEMGRRADANVVLALWNRTRLSKQVVRGILSSHATAKQYFPDMIEVDAETGAETSKQWDALLRKFVAYAPKHMKQEAVKDETGQNIKEVGPDGKERVKRVAVPATQDPAILLHWINTRYAIEATGEDTTVDVSLNFEDISIV